MLLNSCYQMSSCLTSVTSITAWINKLIYSKGFQRAKHSNIKLQHSNIKLHIILTSHLHLKNKFIKKFHSFIHVVVTNDGGQFCTFIFCKETAIGLFTNYLGFTSFSYKVGLFIALLHRVFMISSSCFLFHKEAVKIKQCLEKKLFSPKFC